MRLFEGTPFDQPPRCERCGELEERCDCPVIEQPSWQQIPPEKQRARLAVEKRKKGKSVTVVRGLSPTGNNLAELLAQLKATCGAGGALKEDMLEIQGRHLERVGKYLRDLGYRVQG